MPEQLNRSILCAMLTIFLLDMVPAAQAASFTIVNGQVETAQQTLDADETGTIEAGGQLNTVAPAITNLGGQADATVLNDGSISTTGGSAHGIVSGGANFNVTNSGTISTIGSGARGITSGGLNLNVTNNGTISTIGSVAYGIAFSGDNVSIINSGSITTIGDGARGIWSTTTADNANISNSGSISTEGDDAYGIISEGADAIISNSGSISTMGTSAHGIWSQGVNANITNSGTISTTGVSARGIVSAGAAGLNLTNSGTISTTESSAHAITSSGANASITNSGTISTTGVSARGIWSTGANAIITNCGSIQVTGAGAIGVLMTGTNATLNNCGLISATGDATQAIVGDSGDDTLNLLSGWQIIGDVDLDGGNDTVNILSLSQTSATVVFLNTETINLPGNIPGVVIGNTLTTVDPTGQSVNGAVLGSMTTSLHGIITRRMAYHKELKPVQLATTRLEPGMLFQARTPQAWGEVFGVHRSRDAEGQVLAYDHDYYGFTGGYETDYRQYRIGVMAGLAQSEVETDITSIETDTDSFFAGAYGHFYLGPVNLTATLIGGYEDHDNDRLVLDNLNGFEVASADFDSFFLSPALTLSASYDVGNNIELRPSASMIYSVAWFDDYSESGTTQSNLSIDDRSVQVLSGRLQLAAAQSFGEDVEFEVRVGGTSRHTDEDDIDANLAGTNFRYAAASDDSVYGAYVGANLRVAIQERLNVVADMEYGRASGNEDQIGAHLGLEYSF